MIRSRVSSLVRSSRMRLLAALVALVVLLVPLPAGAHTSAYCGHGSQTSGLWMTVFYGHIANFPVHEHHKRHLEYDPWWNAWYPMHDRYRACYH